MLDFKCISIDGLSQLEVEADRAIRRKIWPEPPCRLWWMNRAEFDVISNGNALPHRLQGARSEQIDFGGAVSSCRDGRVAQGTPILIRAVIDEHENYGRQNVSEPYRTMAQ